MWVIGTTNTLSGGLPRSTANIRIQTEDIFLISVGQISYEQYSGLSKKMGNSISPKLVGDREVITLGRLLCILTHGFHSDSEVKI